MRQFFVKIISAAAVTAVFLGVHSQQASASGIASAPDERKAAADYTLFSDAYRQKNYDRAAEYLMELLEKAPKEEINIYLYGIDIYKDKILKASSLVDKNRFVDSLMIIYDLYAANFGDDPLRGRPYILARKAEEYLTYNPLDSRNVIRYLRDAADAYGEEAELPFLLLYFRRLTEGYETGLIEPEEYIDEYDKLGDIFRLPANAGKTEEQADFEALFTGSGALDCENIEDSFGPAISASPKDTVILRRTLALLTRAGCNGDFYLHVLEKYYDALPGTATALTLARTLESRGDYERAIEYLTHALEAEKNPKSKAELSADMAASYLASGDARSAADHAKQAVSFNPRSGRAYYLLAQAYTAGAEQCTDEFDRGSVYWLVYDNLSNAKRFSGRGDIPDIDRQMYSARRKFPEELDCFLRQLESGRSYTVKCGWISGVTTVRTR